ncbi:MAG TPA: hypothetical protein VM537_34510 [Anaerolineae bacterium]|nr:hypothetical protein [Anaerolineae bacterium]
MSDELREITPHLTGQQWAGIMQIVQAELDGKTQTSVLRSENAPCNYSTFYGRWKKGSGKTKKSQKGWVDNLYFVQALAWARRDYRSWLMEKGTAEAMQVLSRAAAPSARELERQVVGDQAAVEVLSQQLDQAVEKKNEFQITKLAQALGASQLSDALPALVRALDHEWEPETQAALFEAVGSIASPLNVDRQKAGMGILDRLDDTAVKAVISETRDSVSTIDLSGIPDEVVDFFAGLLPGPDDRPGGGDQEIPEGKE